MKAPTTFARLCLAAALLGSLGACTIAPAYPPGYRAPPVVVETYPAYRYGYPYPAYQMATATTSGAAITPGKIGITAKHGAASRRWKARRGCIAMSGAASACPACRGCPERQMPA